MLSDTESYSNLEWDAVQNFTTMFQTLFQISCFTAALIVSISYARTPSLEVRKAF